MKKLAFLFASVMLITSCETHKKSNRNIVLGDTITTQSGLQYVFLNEGYGRKIEEGSKVKIYTDLYLNDADTTIWSTSGDKDSIFAFIHKKTSLIKGFTELHNYLIEGDEIIAILPDSLAYGQKGKGIVPPNATLVYNPLIVKYVSEPKESLVDTLISIAKKDQVKSAITFYEKAANGEFDTNYHSNMDDITEIVYKLMRDSSYVELEGFSKYFASKVSDEDEKQTYLGYQVLSLEQLGNINQAIDIVRPLSESESNKEYWKDWLKRLEDKSK